VLLLEKMTARIVDGRPDAAVRAPAAALLMQAAAGVDAIAVSAWQSVVTMCTAGNTSRSRRVFVEANAFKVAADVLMRHGGGERVVNACLRAVAAVCGYDSDDDADDSDGDSESDGDDSIDEDAIVSAARAGVAAASVASMRRLEHSVDVAASCCKVLSTFTFTRDARLSIARADAIRAVISAMLRHVDAASVQEKGAYALASIMILSPLNSVVIATWNGVGAVVTAMQRHMESARVQAECATTLLYLVDDDSKTRLTVIDAGGVDALVSALRQKCLLDNAVVHERCCEAVSALARPVPFERSVARPIVDAGAVDAVVASMRRHADSARVQRCGCCVLERLSVPATAAAVVRAGGIDAVVAALRRHVSVATVCVPACTALSCIAIAAECEAAVVAAGGIDALLAAVRQHGSCEAVLQCTLPALLMLAADSAERQGAIAHAGAVDVVLAVVQRIPHWSGIRVAGCCLLDQLTACAGVQAAIDHAGGRELMAAYRSVNGSNVPGLVRKVVRAVFGSAFQ
jgi:hypothetical protein